MEAIWISFIGLVSLIALVGIFVVVNKKRQRYEELRNQIRESDKRIKELNESITNIDLKLKNLKDIRERIEKIAVNVDSPIEDSEKVIFDLSIMKTLLIINEHNPNFVEWWLS